MSAEPGRVWPRSLLTVAGVLKRVPSVRKLANKLEERLFDSQLKGGLRYGFFYGPGILVPLGGAAADRSVGERC